MPSARPAEGAVDLEYLERLYRTLNRREFVREDPVSFLYAHGDVSDREVVGLVASSLAYGRVAQIRASVSDALARLGPSPSETLAASSPRRLRKAFDGFRHRFTTGDELVDLLLSVKRIRAEHGSLGGRLAELVSDEDRTVLPALTFLVRELRASLPGPGSSVLPCPELGSACKRLHLFLRWMVRHDAVDPGGWTGLERAKLVVPLDTHMHRIARAVGFTRRRQADARTALEVTESFRRLAPADPVKYDFALTRLGILRQDTMPGEFSSAQGKGMPTC